jgi:2,3-bisphosphoglycerate-independent phosphoglycerate mutase
MKTLLIVCDGLGDRLTKGKTPLEVAHTPNMDFIAKKGICGIMDTVKEGVRPGSDTSHLSLFGYDPYEVYTGRGPFEAFGVGLNLQKGDVAFRCNFSTLKNGKVIDRRAGREEFKLGEIAKEFDGRTIDGVKLIFKKCKGHRAVLVFRGKNLSSNVSDVDPEELNVSPSISHPLNNKKESKKTAKILNEFTKLSEKILKEHRVNKERMKKGMLPANVILARGAGSIPKLKSFQEKYGMKAVCISATTLIIGVCRALNMDIIEVANATGHVDSNISGKADAAIQALKSYDFIFLHIKGTDEASHDGNFSEKKKMIERIDKEVIGPILKNVKNTTTIVLTADHSTPISIRQHSADPVPIAILGDVRTDDVKKFSERSCAKGGLNRIHGRNLVNILLDLSDKAKLFGA